MQIWVDADACPVVARQLIIKASERTQTPVTFVANSPLAIKTSQRVKMHCVNQGFDVADDYIVAQVQRGDLVITSDIPLASEVLANSCLVVSARGFVYTLENIKQKLSMRDFMDSMRDTLQASGKQVSGQAAYGAKDKQAFANVLNRLVK